MPRTTLQPHERALLESRPVGYLATNGPTGRPHLVPVCFALVDGDHRPLLAIAIDEKPKRHAHLTRVANLRRDPRAALLVDHYETDWARLAWLRLDLEGAVLDRGDAWPAALAALRDRYPQYRPMHLEARPLLRLRIVGIASWFATPSP